MYLSAKSVLVHTIHLNEERKCVTMYLCVLKAIKCYDGIKADVNVKTGDKNGKRIGRVRPRKSGEGKVKWILGREGEQ